MDPQQPAAATTLNGAAPVVPAVLAAGPLLGKGLALAGPYDAGLAYGGKGLAFPSAYSVATQHISAGPVLAGPVALAAAPLVAGPLLGKGLGLAAPLDAGLSYGAYAKGLY